MLRDLARQVARGNIEGVDKAISDELLRLCDRECWDMRDVFNAILNFFKDVSRYSEPYTGDEVPEPITTLDIVYGICVLNYPLHSELAKAISESADLIGLFEHEIIDRAFKLTSYNDQARFDEEIKSIVQEEGVCDYRNFPKLFKLTSKERFTIAEAFLEELSSKVGNGELHTSLEYIASIPEFDDENSLLSFLNGVRHTITRPDGSNPSESLKTDSKVTEVSIFGSVHRKSYNLLATHPEEMRFFTDGINFEYTITNIFKELNPSNWEHTKGCLFYNGEILCHNCDGNRDECTCEERSFDFDEAESAVEAFNHKLEVLEDEISEMATGDHDVHNFIYKTFKPVLTAVNRVKGSSSPFESCKVVRDALVATAADYNSYLAEHGKNSLPPFRLV